MERSWEKQEIQQLTDRYPLIEDLKNKKESFWRNSELKRVDDALTTLDITMTDVKEASDRLKRFSAYIKTAFPETLGTDGIIESDIKQIDQMKSELEEIYEINIEGSLWLKKDSHLPIAGSIKARGGIYEVLQHAETLAIEHGLLKEGDDYSVFDSDEFKALFSKYSIAVGSTGNLGLSIGTISAKLGFNVYVHMSSDAKKWKKDKLRSCGVTVVEYDSDYSVAVAQGREQAKSDPNMYFVDDENSRSLFMGYAVAALRLREQLDKNSIKVDGEHPLFVYLPCGVGGGPGGVAFGLKLVFGDSVHAFFAEPVNSPCMLLGMMTGLNQQISVFDIGLDNKTAADGLAVGRASGFIGDVMKNLLSGIYTVDDEELFLMLSSLADSEGIFLEPSALAGMYGLKWMFGSEEGTGYITDSHLVDSMKNAVHLVWATGGSMVPEDEMKRYYDKGKSLRKV